jgi:AcrR family transcriptional regulator
MVERHSISVKMVLMATSKRNPRRSDALSRDRIVEAAIEILDTEDESDLTFRALTTRLSTGAGAIYHHVANKNELLAAATDEVIGRVLAEIAGDTEPTRAIRAISLGIFDAIDAHPWVGAQLSHDPQPAVLRIWKAIGLQLRDLGVTGSAQSDAGSALISYVLGSAAQYAAGARRSPNDTDRKAYLEALAAQWTQRDPDPFVDEMATQLREHNDREQFLAGVEIFLTGITTQTSWLVPRPQ